MEPYIFSHMMASIDGRIDGSTMTAIIDPSNRYYDALNAHNCDSQIMERTTMEIHYTHRNASMPIP